MFSKKMLDALNNQIRDEFYSEYFYLAMSAWLDAHDLPGMAQFQRVKSQEERTHAIKLFEYVQSRDGNVVLLALPKPPADYKSFLDLFEHQLKHEQSVTASIHNLYALAMEEHDYATSVTLQWFVGEQVEEEKEAKEIIQKCKMVGENESALFLLDQQLGATMPAADTAQK